MTDFDFGRVFFLLRFEVCTVRVALFKNKFSALLAGAIDSKLAT